MKAPINSVVTLGAKPDAFHDCFTQNGSTSCYETMVANYYDYRNAVPKVTVNIFARYFINKSIAALFFKYDHDIMNKQVMQGRFAPRMFCRMINIRLQYGKKNT